MLKINVVTIFPDFFSGPLGISIPYKAAAAGSVRYNLVDLRSFTYDKHRTVDDYPYGGGPGMVMKPGPFFEAVDSILEEQGSAGEQSGTVGEQGSGIVKEQDGVVDEQNGVVEKHADASERNPALNPIVLLSPRGKVFSNDDAIRFANCESVTFLCGHYKDVDQRVADHLATEEISLGNFVLSGGEPAALAIIDAIVRLLPGAMSDHESAYSDSFYDGRGVSAPSYTRPPEYRGHKVPDILLSGDHAKIAKWKKEQER